MHLSSNQAWSYVQEFHACIQTWKPKTMARTMGNASPPARSPALANVRTCKSQWNSHLRHWVTEDVKSQVKGVCGAQVYPRASCSYLVVRSHIEGHKPLEENFGGLVVAEKGISVNVVAGSGVKQPKQTREPKTRHARGHSDMWLSLSLSRGVPHLSRNSSGKEKKGNRECSTFSTPESKGFTPKPFV